MELERKRKNEQEMVEKMIHIYCRGKHKSKKGCLCPQCQALADYARARTERCPRMAEKTFCSAARFEWILSRIVRKPRFSGIGAFFAGKPAKCKNNMKRDWIY